MQTGLQYIRKTAAFYYFDENGYMQTARSKCRGDDDAYNFYFNHKERQERPGLTGEKDNYLYFDGKRLEADDDYRLYLLRWKISTCKQQG